MPTDRNNLYQCDGDGIIRWTKIAIYYLCLPEGDSCSADDIKSPQDPGRFCPHKKLVKVTYFLNQPDALRLNSNTPLDSLVENIGKVLKEPPGAYPELEGLSFYDFKIVADNVLDFEVNSDKKGRISFKVSIVRIDEAGKSIVVGSTDFTQDPGKKYVESLDWMSVTP